MQHQVVRVIFSLMPIVRNYSRYKGNTVLHSSLEDFYREQLVEGIQVIPFGNSILEILVQNRHSATTLVIFHAAVDPKKTSLPVFIGHQLTAELDANLVFVSEPALERGVSIGWFTGSPDQILQSELVNVLAHIQCGLEKAEHLIFYGSSAGGFASLYYSHHFTDSLAIVANPQTDILKYHSAHVNRFLERVWDTDDIRGVPAQTEVCSLYENSFPNYVGYLQNSKDILHIREHCLPWAEVTENFEDRRGFLIDNWGKGHTPPNFFLLQGVLQYAASLNGDWKAFLDDESFSTNPVFET